MSISSHDLQQVLVVGDGVQPVERMRHVDQAALAADLGDRLRHRHPALDLLLEEEPDHLALVGGLHLLGDDHLDPADPLGDLARLERAGDLVVVGDRDRAEAALLRRLQQDLDGRRAVRASDRCACAGRSGCSSRSASRRADLGVARRVVAPRGQPPVDRLDLVGHLLPGRARRRSRGPLARSRSRSSASSQSRSSCARQRLRVADREQQARARRRRPARGRARGRRRPGPRRPPAPCGPARARSGPRRRRGRRCRRPR